MKGTTIPHSIHKKKYDKYTTDDFDELAFHDSIIDGLSWKVIDNTKGLFSMSLRIRYIREPIIKNNFVRAKKSKGVLTFNRIFDLKINLQWDNYCSEPVIVSLTKHHAKIPSQFLHKSILTARPLRTYWEIKLAEPNGNISFFGEEAELLIEKKMFIEDM